MPDNKNISVPRQGMIQDVSAISLKESQYPYALNAAIESNSQNGDFFTLQNEGSNVLTTQFPAGFRVIKQLPVHEQNRTLFFLVNPTTNKSIIGEIIDCNYDDDTDDLNTYGGCDTCSHPVQRETTPLEQKTQTPYCPFHTIIDADCLNFSLDYPIKARYKITDCGLNIYFTDNLNQRRFVYFDYSDGTNRSLLELQERFKVVTGFEDDDCAQPIYADELDCNKIKYHPKFEIPCIKSVEVISGGELKAGTYQALIAYADKDGNVLTEYFPATNPTPIFSRYITTDTDYTTDKAIKINIDNLDQTFLYGYYNLIIAETVNSFTTFKLLGTYPVTQSNALYTGNDENLKRLDASEIFIRKAYYEKAANIGDANGLLFFSNLTEFSKPNLQRPTNKVKLYWQTVAIPESVYRTPEYSERYRSHMRDEVYPYSLEYITDEGEVLGTYHIPGPSREYFKDTYGIDVDAPVTNDDAIKHKNCDDPDCDCNTGGGNEEPVSDVIKGTIAIVCWDDNCDQQGEPQLVMTFDRPLPNPVHFQLGAVIYYTNPALPSSFVRYRYVGSDIFTPPTGSVPWDYYDNPNAMGHGVPIYVDIPAGVTSFQTSAPTDGIGVSPELFQEGITSANWQSEHLGWGSFVCFSCDQPFVQLHIKPVAATGENFLFTTQQNMQVFNIPNDVTPEGEETPPEEPQPTPNCKCHPTYWETYNTAVVIGTPHEVIDECGDDKVWEWGDFAYWESTRRYPNDPEIWGELCGKPIRHHKFPDSLVSHIHDSKDGSKGFKDNNVVFPIGVRIDHQSVIDALDEAVTEGIISQEDRNRISSYRLVRGNRVGQKSVLSKGLIFDMWNYSKDGNTYYYPNYPYNDLRNDNFISNDSNTYNGSNTSSPIPNVFSATGRYTLHSPDIHFQNESIGNILKLETLEYGESEGYFNYCEEQAKQRFLSTAATTLAFAAGVAAAFSATEEKECVTYRLQADAKTTSHVDGETPVGIVSGGGGTLVSGSGTIVNNTTIVENHAFSADGEARTELNNPYAQAEFSFQEWGRASGTTAGQPIQQIKEIEKTTCKGTPYQLLSPLSGSAVGAFLQQAIYKGVLGMKEMQIMVDLIKALIPLKNFSVQYNSAGKYVNYKTIANEGNKIRAIKNSSYLEPIFQSINEDVDVATSEFTLSLINNWKRERSVYLAVDPAKKFPNPSVVDNSRNTLDDLGFEQEDLNKKFYKTISSYYASVKRWLPDQYGSLSDIEYLPTGSCDFKLDETYGVSQTSVFGGDTFINRFALKRKHPFFLQTRFKMDNESDVEYSSLANAGYPNFFFNTEKPLMERLASDTFGGDILGIVSDLLGVAESRLDARKNKFFYQSGFIHLYSYGIPYFFTESDINVDYRHGNNSLEGDFYPHQQDLGFWLQEKNVPISEDNTYFYNKTYSKQNKEAFIQPQVKELVKDCKITYPSSVIQSEEDLHDSDVDKWLIFKPNNIFHFPASNGRIIGLDGIENDKVLVRFENSAHIFGAYSTFNTDSETIAVGNGGVFNSRPKQFASTSLGFAGSQNTDILLTEFGHIWADAKRGQIFNLGSGASKMEELGKDGLKNWLKENLPFQILKDFPEFPLEDIDNNYKGIGLHLSFDKRFSRFFLTKLDYRKLRNDITYDKITKQFLRGGQVVSLNDTAYFCNRSWTLSYNFLTQSWVSFYSFTPNYYVDNVDYFQSGLNSDASTLWSHNVTNKSYQVYYGKLYPFSVEIVSTPMMIGGALNSVEFLTDALRYHNQNDYFYNRNVTFNKAVITTEYACSGQLELNVRDEENLFQSISYPKVEDNKIQILVTNVNGIWRFNQFWDTVTSQNNNLPLFKNKCSNAEKEVNTLALNYYKPDELKQKIRGRQSKILFTNDIHSNYKLLFHLAQQQISNG